jgi:hypothetical protein
LQNTCFDWWREAWQRVTVRVVELICSPAGRGQKEKF